MTQRMSEFVTVIQHSPNKRAVSERARDFSEIYAGFTPPQGGKQASRCSQCGVPFCQTGCPLQNNIPDWLRLAADGRMQDAWRLSEATSALPEICGRICPQDRLCEDACVLEQSGWESVTIGAVERHISDTAWEQGWIEPIVPSEEKSQSVGIIGSGPAGIAAADWLRRLGYQVTIYDRYDRAGGLLTYGIPGFKLEKPVVARRTQRLADSGVSFVLNFEVGRDASLEELRERHAAVFVATGVYNARRLTGPGVGSDSVVRALDYLIASNRLGFGDEVPEFDSGRLDAAGKDVVVVGGGDTAMDCVRTAVRQGARSVTCLYRRDRGNMPGSHREVTHAEEEGVRFEWLAAPKAIHGDAQSVDHVRAVRMHLGPPDASGRRSVEEAHGEEFDVPAQLVIEALGFEPEDLPGLFGAPELRVSRYGTLTVDENNMTSLPGVFAGGDIVRGASLVVWGVKDGQDAALSIDRYIRGETAEQSLRDAEFQGVAA
ncbi:MAG: NAD(P)-dependent oxidoreductase [Caulobacteraceae bacterium]